MVLLHVDVPIEQVKGFCLKWKVREFSLFGSVLRDDFGPDSDVDVLVELEPDHPWTLHGWIDMIEELKELFGREVDLVEKAAVRNPFRRRHIMNNRWVVYAA